MQDGFGVSERDREEERKGGEREERERERKRERKLRTGGRKFSGRTENEGRRRGRATNGDAAWN